MSPGEIELFLCAARGKHFAVEFGVGGSTFCLIDAGIDRVFSVESDITWIETIITHEHLRPHVASGRLTMHHGDIGPTRKWGHPLDNSRIDDWPNYWREPWRQIPANEVDLVFIDGRFRVACALHALEQGTQDMTVMVHDFWNRPKYEVLLKYFNCACRADTLAVFFPKARVDLDSLQEDLRRHSYKSA